MGERRTINHTRRKRTVAREGSVAIATLADIEALERSPLEQYRPEQSVFDLLARVAALHPDKLAIRYLAAPAPEAPTRDIFRRIVQAANLFRELGVGPHDAVSMLLPILPETFFAMFGAQAAGIANPINFLLEPEHIAALLRQARCRVLLGPDPSVFPGVWEKVEAIRNAVPTLAAIIRVGGPAERPDIDALHFERELEACPADKLSFTREIRGDDVAGLFHTGGTTSLPKLARHTHRGLITQSWSNSVVLRPGPDEIWFNGLPPYNIDPLVIEEALHQHPAVEIAAAVGRPDAHAGEHPIAFVQLKAGSRALPEELRDFAMARIPERAALPERWWCLTPSVRPRKPAMPLTAVGKIFKPRLFVGLREPLENHARRLVETASAPRAVWRWLGHRRQSQRLSPTCHIQDADRPRRQASL
jgi:acyl-CoA synthetase (AMP-forming)/AMP-acid ligase II